MQIKKIKIASIDLYNNEPNEGMRCIKDIISEIAMNNKNFHITYSTYQTRYLNEIPSDDYDIYISSGGPGSPFDGENSEWEKNYFNLIDSIWNFNQSSSGNKKFIFFICHSFQLMSRFFNLADVNKRDEKSFGILKFMKTPEGKSDSLLARLDDEFYAADFRQYQVVNPNEKTFSELNAKILATEIPSENNSDRLALMAIRISEEIAGTQFHPEADPKSMLHHLKQEERKNFVISKYGQEKYYEMLSLAESDSAIKLTRKTVLPNFLNFAIDKLVAQLQD